MDMNPVCMIKSTNRMTHFVRDGEKVELVPSTLTFTVHATDVPVSAVAQALTADKLKVLVSRAPLGILVVESPGGSGAVTRALEGAGLSARTKVTPSFLQAGDNELDPWSPTGRIVVRFQEDAEPAAISAILARYDLRILSDLEDIPKGYILFAPNSDPVEIARALVEDEHLPDAEPEFIRRFVTYQQAS